MKEEKQKKTEDKLDKQKKVESKLREARALPNDAIKNAMDQASNTAFSFLGSALKMLKQEFSIEKAHLAKFPEYIPLLRTLIEVQAQDYACTWETMIGDRKASAFIQNGKYIWTGHSRIADAIQDLESGKCCGGCGNKKGTEEKQGDNA